MAANYATVSDIIAIGKNLTAEEQASAEILIQTASSKIRIIARKYGIDIDNDAAAEAVIPMHKRIEQHLA